MNQLDVAALRRDFPVLDRTIYGKPLIYLDNTATSQTPSCVVDTIRDIYFHTKANVHRGVHTMSQEMTAMQEATRERVRQMLNAESTSEIIFTRGTTEAINLVASSMGDSFVDGDEVIVTVMEHHANIVPWQLLSRNKRVTLRVVPMDERGVLDLEAYRSLFNSHTRMVAVTHVSNVLGTVNPVKEMIAEAHRHGVPVLVDGAQAVAHMSVDVRDLDCDFYVFSSHKMYGPTGVGVLYGKRSMLMGGDSVDAYTLHVFDSGVQCRDSNEVGCSRLELEREFGKCRVLECHVGYHLASALIGRHHLKQTRP